VLISSEEHERLKRRDRQVLGLEDFATADIAALDVSRPLAGSRIFDPELTD
jgi:hypothetical protein